MGVKGVKVLGGGSHTDQNPPQSFSCDSQLSTSNPSERCEGSQTQLQPNLLQKKIQHFYINTLTLTRLMTFIVLLVTVWSY